MSHVALSTLEDCYTSMLGFQLSILDIETLPCNLRGVAVLRIRVSFFLEFWLLASAGLLLQSAGAGH